MNKERIRKLIKEGKMTIHGINAIGNNFSKNKSSQLIVAQDILKALKSDKKVWKNFQKFPRNYIRIRIAYLESQRAHNKKMFLKSLRYLIKMTAKNKKFGMIK